MTFKPNVGDLPVHGKSLSLQAGRYDRHRFFVHLAGFGGTWWLSAGIHRIFRHPHLWKPIASWVRIMLNLNISITLTFGGQWLKHPQVPHIFRHYVFQHFPAGMVGLSVPDQSCRSEPERHCHGGCDLVQLRGCWLALPWAHYELSHIFGLQMWLFLVHIPVHTHVIHLIRCVHGSSKTSAFADAFRLFNLSNRLSAVS